MSPPRIAPLRLDGLRDVDEAVFEAGETYDGERYRRPALDGLDLSGADFIDCELNGASLNEAQLRGVRFRHCRLADSFAPVLSAVRSTWREVEVTSPRWGSAELHDATFASVRIDGGKLDYLNLRAAKITDLVITGCIINELDLSGAAATRVSLQDCTIGTLDVRAAKLKDVDLRTSSLRTLNGIGSLAGAVIDDDQLALMAPLFAAQLGITVL
ncbi:MAG: pentapeptide repeat-containing protein [Actinomycetales bacterium]